MAEILKRDATETEEYAAVFVYSHIYPDSDYPAMVEKAKQDGYKTEVCDCGSILPACVHFTRCRVEGCPFRSKSDPRSVLEQLTSAIKGEQG